jgi:hypothetical protein
VEEGDQCDADAGEQGHAGILPLGSGSATGAGPEDRCR